MTSATAEDFGLVLFSAAYAATAAPQTSTAVEPRIAMPVRQPGPPPKRRGLAVPHCRHQSWPSCIGSPHFEHS